MNEDLRLRHQLLKFGTARAGRAPAPPPLDAVLPPVDADQAEAALRLSLGARPVGTQRFPGARRSRSAGAAEQLRPAHPVRKPCWTCCCVACIRRPAGRVAEPDVHLVATLLSLNRVMPNKTKATTRKAVTQVVEELERKLAAPMCQAVSSSLNRAARKLRPRHQDIDWLRDIVLCVVQSGSMASSVVYAGVFAAVLASIKAVSTSVVVFDTVVADLAPLLSGPVEVLFGTQLGGGTDINRALAYCQG